MLILGFPVGKMHRFSLSELCKYTRTNALVRTLRKSENALRKRLEESGDVFQAHDIRICLMVGGATW